MSVIVPVFNTEKYVAGCIESIRRQTFADFELILVDDGSTDGSGALCDRFAAGDDRIAVLHKPNGGLSDARNAGLDVAKGRFITFVDADDEVDERMLQHMVRMQRESKADICAVAFDCFSTAPATPKIPKGSITVDGLTAAEMMLYQVRGFENSACAKLYDARLWSDMRFTTGIGYEDLDAIPRLCLSAARYCYSPARLYHYRQHDMSYLHRCTPGRADVLDVTQRLVDLMRTRHPELVKAAESRQLSANFDIFTMFSANNAFPETADRAWRKIKELRLRALADGKVRLKNKLGVLLSYIGGRRLLTAIARMAPGIAKRGC